MSRAILPLCVAVLFGFSAARAADEEVQALVTKAVKAHGGKEALTKNQAAKSKNKGKINLPGVGEVEFTQELAFMYPDKLKDRLEMDIAGTKVSVATVVNGDKMAIDANGMEVKITDEIKKSIQDAQHAMRVGRLVTLLEDKNFKLSSLGEIKVEGKAAVGIGVAAKGRPDINLYFTKESGLLAKIEYRSVDPQTSKERTEERIILEYQKKDGIPVPKKILVQHDGAKFLEVEVEEIKFYETLDESEFKK